MIDIISYYIIFIDGDEEIIEEEGDEEEEDDDDEEEGEEITVDQLLVSDMFLSMLYDIWRQSRGLGVYTVYE